VKPSSRKIEASAQVSPRSLLDAARESLGRAYAPYSKFPVAAAVVDDEGRVFTGVNVENASYGLTMCAERVAIFTAVAAGARKLRALALTSKNGGVLMPCGACRQVMAELFDASAPVYSDTGKDRYKTTTLRDLLPKPFGPDDL
jgi:cytidine deaminase